MVNLADIHSIFQKVCQVCHYWFNNKTLRNIIYSILGFFSSFLNNYISLKIFITLDNTT